MKTQAAAPSGATTGQHERHPERPRPVAAPCTRSTSTPTQTSANANSVPMFVRS